MLLPLIINNFNIICSFLVENFYSIMLIYCCLIFFCKIIPIVVAPNSEEPEKLDAPNSEEFQSNCLINITSNVLAVKVKKVKLEELDEKVKIKNKKNKK